MSTRAPGPLTATLCALAHRSSSLSPFVRTSTTSASPDRLQGPPQQYRHQPQHHRRPTQDDIESTGLPSDRRNDSLTVGTMAATWPTSRIRSDGESHKSRCEAIAPGERRTKRFTSRTQGSFTMLNRAALPTEAQNDIMRCGNRSRSDAHGPRGGDGCGAASGTCCDRKQLDDD